MFCFLVGKDGIGANNIKHGNDDIFLNKLSLGDDKFMFSCISST